MFKIFKNFIAKDLGIDIGTSSIFIYEKGSGIKLNEASTVALLTDGSNNIPYLFGNTAKMMTGRSPENVKIVRPMRDGVVADFYVVEEMIRHFVGSVVGGWKLTRPLVVVCVPYESTVTERIALQEAILKSSGARDVYFVYETIAAAMGANLQVGDHSGSMVIDIGGGTTDISVISLGSIIVGRSFKIAGDKFNETIIEFMKKEYNLLIGVATAEKIKHEVGAIYVSKNDEVLKMSVKGRDIGSGVPKVLEITNFDIAKGMEPLLVSIIGYVKHVLNFIPPELSSDILEKGIVLTGGSSQIRGLDEAISNALDCKVFVAENPSLCVVNGLGKIIEKFSTYSQLLFKQS